MTVLDLAGRLVPCLLGLLAAVPVATGAPASVGALHASGVDGDDASTIVAELLATRDASDPDRVHELAELGTQEALDGLVEVYEGVGSIFMRREIIRALPAFADGPAAGAALERLANTGTQAREPELREAAIDALESCADRGKPFLRRIVESPADDQVRELAFAAHLRLAEPADEAWYRVVYRPPTPTEEEREEAKRQRKQDRKRERRGETVEVEVRVPLLAELRVMAFEHLVPELTDDELAAALRDATPRIRARALAELEARGDERAPAAAARWFENLQDAPVNRAAAAGVLVREHGAEIAPELVDTATRADTPHVLRYALADLLRELDAPEVDKKLMGRLGKGKPYEKLFTLRATRDADDPKYVARVARLARDRDPEVAAAACAVLAGCGDPAALPTLQKLVASSKDATVRSAALDALAELSTGPSAFTEEELLELLEHDDVVVRNLALRELGRDPAELPRLVAALEDDQWSTRATALEALVALRSAEAIPPIVDRMGRERGRFVPLFAEALWRLTGQPYETSHARWVRWWEREGEGFEPIEPAELELLEAQREERRLRAVSRVEREFFGIEIVSERVVFVLDISGSMGRTMRADGPGQGRSRIAVARERLQRAIEALDGATLFNVVVFDFDLQTWNDRCVLATPEAKAEAVAFIERVGLGPGTNLYGALREAFADPDADTLYVVSDGAPEGGDEDDPWVIRERVQRWNANRRIVIHTVTVGGRLQILQWLAEDSGGSHVRLQ